MNKQPGLIAQVFRFDSPAEIWRFWNWVHVLALWPFLITIGLLDVGSSLTGLGVVVTCGIVIAVAYYTLRNWLVSKGAPKDELDAISKGICRSAGATALIGGLIVMVPMVSVSMFTKALEVYETFLNETNLIMHFVIANVIVALSAFIGWRLKGRKLYEKYVPKPNNGESR